MPQSARRQAGPGRPRRNPRINRRIGAHIRRARNAKGYTQGYLARLIDETDTNGPLNVSRWERGANRPSDEKLERIAEVLGLAGMHVFFEVLGDEDEAAA